MSFGVKNELNRFNLIAGHFNAPDFTTVVEIDHLDFRIGAFAQQ